MTTTLDAETIAALRLAGLTDDQISIVTAALDEAARGHAKMSAELALRIVRMMSEHGAVKTDNGTRRRRSDALPAPAVGRCANV